MNRGLGRSTSRWANIVLAVSITTGLIVLAIAWTQRESTQALNSGATWATIISGTLTVLALVLQWHSGHENRAIRSLEIENAALNALARIVLRESKENLAQLLTITEPSSTPALLHYSSASPGRSSPGKTRRAGTILDVASYFTETPDGRLLIIGASGSGKTVLATHLAVSYATGQDTSRTASATEGTGVPVILSATSWNPFSQTFEEWVSSQISSRYDLKFALAEALVLNGQIIPILDGLDEMSGETPLQQRISHAAVQINRYFATNPRGRIVVTMRASETTANAVLRKLGPISTIHLEPLTAPQIKNHVRRSVRDEVERLDWEQFFTAADLSRSTPVRDALSTPWKLTMAIMFRSMGGSLQSLLPQDDERLENGRIVGAYRSRVSNTLVDTYIASQAQEYRGARSTSTTMRRGLSTLALIAASDRGANMPPTIIPHELPEAFDEKHFRSFCAIVVFIAAKLPLIAFGFIAGGLSAPDRIGAIILLCLVATNYLCAFFYAIHSLTRRSSPRRLDLSRLHDRQARKILAMGIMSILVLGAVYAIIGAPLYGITIGISIAALTGLIALRADGYAPGKLTPEVAVRHDLTYSSGIALSSFLFAAIYYCEFLGPLGLLPASWIPVAILLASNSARYFVATMYGASIRRLPFLYSRHLRSLRETGILRLSSEGYQFRHSQIFTRLHQVAAPSAPGGNSSD